MHCARNDISFRDVTKHAYKYFCVCDWCQNSFRFFFFVYGHVLVLRSVKWKKESVGVIEALAQIRA